MVFGDFLTGYAFGIDAVSSGASFAFEYKSKCILSGEEPYLYHEFASDLFNLVANTQVDAC